MSDFEFEVEASKTSSQLTNAKRHVRQLLLCEQSRLHTKLVTAIGILVIHAIDGIKLIRLHWFLVQSLVVEKTVNEA